MGLLVISEIANRYRGRAIPSNAAWPRASVARGHTFSGRAFFEREGGARNLRLRFAVAPARMTARPETALSRMVCRLNVDVCGDLPRSPADGRTGTRTWVGLRLASLSKRMRVTLAEQPRPA